MTARFHDVLAIASRMSCIDWDVLIGKSRYKPLSIVRAAAFTVGAERGHGYSPTARVMRKDHSTAMHAVKESMPDYIGKGTGADRFLADLRAACDREDIVFLTTRFSREQRRRAWAKYEFLAMFAGDMIKAGFSEPVPDTVKQPATVKVTYQPFILVEAPPDPEPAWCNQCQHLAAPAEVAACKWQRCSLREARAA